MLENESDRDVTRAARTFDKIAEHFDRTRTRTWKEVVEFLSTCSGKVLVLGCGNGRHCKVGVDRGFDITGIDASQRLLEIARSKVKEADFVRSGVKYLPFKNRTFSDIVYIATIHHLKSGRLDSLKEAKRVLKEGGRILVSSWAREQERWDLKEEERDVIVPWHMDEEVVERFYHLYSLSELREDVKEGGFEVNQSFHSNGNNYVIGEK